MIKNDALDVNFDLNHRWKCLIEDVYNDYFEYKYFQLLAVHTFAYLFPYHSKRNIPKDLVSVLFKIKEFAAISNPICSAWDTHAAQIVANAFCEQMESGWVKIDGSFDENLFVVFDNNDYHLIDSNTFDLTMFQE